MKNVKSFLCCSILWWWPLHNYSRWCTESKHIKMLCTNNRCSLCIFIVWYYWLYLLAKCNHMSSLWVKVQSKTSFALFCWTELVNLVQATPLLLTVAVIELSDIAFAVSFPCYLSDLSLSSVADQVSVQIPNDDTTIMFAAWFNTSSSWCHKGSLYSFYFKSVCYFRYSLSTLWFS